MQFLIISRLFETPMGFGYLANHFMAELREQTLQLLIPADVPQYLLDRHEWSESVEYREFRIWIHNLPHRCCKCHS